MASDPLDAAFEAQYAESLCFDISGDREFVGEGGLQPANQGQPNVFPAQRAAELGQPITDGNTDFTKVKLSTKSFDAEAAEIMANALRQLEVSVHYLSVADL